MPRALLSKVEGAMKYVYGCRFWDTYLCLLAVYLWVLTQYEYLTYLVDSSVCWGLVSVASLPFFVIVVCRRRERVFLGSALRSSRLQFVVAQKRNDR